jgi:hypothetical protein
MASPLASRHTYHHAMSLSNCYGQLGTSMVGPKAARHVAYVFVWEGLHVTVRPCRMLSFVVQVRNVFTAANATASVLPAAPALGTLAVDYNLAVWGGNTTAYLTCNLDIRGPEYLGTCADMPVTCAANAVDARPYNCTRVSDGTGIFGNISDASYRCALHSSDAFQSS